MAGTRVGALVDGTARAGAFPRAGPEPVGPEPVGTGPAGIGRTRRGAAVGPRCSGDAVASATLGVAAGGTGAVRDAAQLTPRPKAPATSVRPVPSRSLRPLRRPAGLGAERR